MRLAELDTAGIAYRFLGPTAMDHFCGLPKSPVVYLEAAAGTVELATACEEPSFPGLIGWDVLVSAGGHEALIRSEDSADTLPAHLTDPFSTFSWDPMRRAFADPSGLYPLLKEARRRIRDVSATKGRTLADAEPVPISTFPEIAAALPPLAPTTAAILTARLPIGISAAFIEPWNANSAMPPLFHRSVIAAVLTGPWADRGLEILFHSGYIADVLPEIAEMDLIEHSKEGHPEGNVWRHSVETLRYRKSRDLTVALALLLHDSGKPQSHSNGAKKFDGHADIGAHVAARVLDRLGFRREIVDDVRWLVRYHMIPGALRRLPDYRRDPIMSSALFPLLLEVYRCDLSSTFRGPENYYDACTVYRRFLKSQRGRVDLPDQKLVKMYTE
jgi:poly(A) polymerase